MVQLNFTTILKKKRKKNTAVANKITVSILYKNLSDLNKQVS
jgi:hypothetical protein